MKKGRHRRFEEARALKRSQEVDLEDLFESINDDDKGEHKPEHDAWADLAEEWETQTDSEDGAKSEDAALASDESDASDSAESGDSTDAGDSNEAVESNDAIDSADEEPTSES